MINVPSKLCVYVIYSVAVAVPVWN